MQKIPNKNTFKGFTLVELIIVITILSILATIAYISFQGYTKDARDGVRMSDIKQIYNGLSIYKTQTEKTLLPDNYINIQNGTTTISYQGYAGASVLRTLKISGGKDPGTKDYYIYTTDANTKKAQLMTYMETSDKDVQLLSKMFVNQANAVTNTGYYQDKKIYVYGDKIGILTNSNKVPLQETTTNTGIDITTLTGNVTTYFGGSVYSGGLSTSTGLTLINQINGAITNTLPCSSTTYNGYTITSLQDKQSQTFTKTGAIDNGTQTGSIIATCNNGTLSYSSENTQTICTNGYNWNGSVCEALYMNLANSLRFDSSRSTYLNKSLSINGNRQKWTWSGWIKSTYDGRLFSASDSASYYTNIMLSTCKIYSSYSIPGYSWQMTSINSVCSSSDWFHLTWVVDTTQNTDTERIKIYVNGARLLMSYNNYAPQNSNLMVNLSGEPHYIGSRYWGNGIFSGYMSDVNFIDGQALGPENFGANIGGKWLPKSLTKSSLITGGTIFGDMVDKGGINAAFDGTIGQGYLSDTSKNLGTANGGYVGKTWSTEQSVRSVIVYPSNDRGWSGGSSVTVQIYGKNGTPSNSTDGTLLASQAGVTALNNTSPVSFGGLNGSYTHYWARIVNTNTNEDLHIGEVLFYGDGITYGVNGFHLDFKDSANLGKDVVGTNNWTLQNYTTPANDQMIDTPTNNFNTLSYTDRRQAGTLYNGSMIYNGNTGVRWWRGTQTNLTSGKYYIEFVPNSSSRTYLGLGIAPSSNTYTDTDSVYPYKVANGWGIMLGSAGAGTDYWIWNNNTSMGNVDVGIGTTTVIQMKVDLDNDTVSFGYNNNWIYTGSLNSSVPAWSIVGHVYNTAEYYFGQGGKSSLNWCSEAGGYFHICPPAGFKSLSSKNIGN